MVIGVLRLGLEWPVRVLVSGGVIRSFLRALRLSVLCMFFFSVFCLYKVYNSQRNCLKWRVFFVLYLFFLHNLFYIVFSIFYNIENTIENTLYKKNIDTKQAHVQNQRQRILVRFMSGFYVWVFYVFAYEWVFYVFAYECFMFYGFFMCSLMKFYVL